MHHTIDNIKTLIISLLNTMHTVQTVKYTALVYIINAGLMNLK